MGQGCTLTVHRYPFVICIRNFHLSQPQIYVYSVYARIDMWIRMVSTQNEIENWYKQIIRLALSLSTFHEIWFSSSSSPSISADRQVVVWIPRIPLWKGLLRKGVSLESPNHQLTHELTVKPYPVAQAPKFTTIKVDHFVYEMCWRDFFRHTAAPWRFCWSCPGNASYFRRVKWPWEPYLGVEL